MFQRRESIYKNTLRQPKLVNLVVLRVNSLHFLYLISLKLLDARKGEGARLISAIEAPILKSLFYGLYNPKRNDSQKDRIGWRMSEGTCSSFAERNLNSQLVATQLCFPILLLLLSSQTSLMENLHGKEERWMESMALAGDLNCW